MVRKLPRRLRSTIGIAPFRKAIEYEYRCTEYEYEYDEIQCEARSED
jgi:hypothetical protein